LDSLLHTNIKRIIVGIVSGLLAGVVLLLITMAFTPEGAPKHWWLLLTGSVAFTRNHIANGNGWALAWDGHPEVLIAGLVVHFFLAALCGFLVGKMTRSNDTPKLMAYGLVLGGLCWLASNMFAPDFLDVQFLQSVGQWVRLVIFMSFTLSLGFLMSVLGRAVGN
jgi:hypothetical protein